MRSHGAELVIGRDAGGGIMFADAPVSRRHCRVRQLRGVAWLTDVDSTCQEGVQEAERLVGRKRRGKHARVSGHAERFGGDVCGAISDVCGAAGRFD